MFALLVFAFIHAVGSWSAWPNGSEIRLPPNTPPGYVRFTMPPELETAVSLRIIDDRGNEIPFVVDPDRHRRAADEDRPVALTDVGFVPGKGTHAVVDFGAPEREHTAVGITTPKKLFFERVVVETSDDRKHWSIVRNDAYIFRVAGDDAESTTIGFPPSHARYLRFMILAPHAAFPLEGARVERVADAPRDRFVPLPGVERTVDHTQNGRDRWIFRANAPVRAAAVEFSGASGQFARTVTVETSTDGTTWVPQVSDSIERFAHGAPHLTFAIPDDAFTYRRVTVENGNDRPVAGLQPALLTQPVDVLFALDPKRHYTMLWGNPDASEAHYDLAARLEHMDWQARKATTGPVADNDAYRDRRELFERFPILLPACFTLFAALILILAVRLLREAAADDPAEEDV